MILRIPSHCSLFSFFWFTEKLSKRQFPFLLSPLSVASPCARLHQGRTVATAVELRPEHHHHSVLVTHFLCIWTSAEWHSTWNGFTAQESLHSLLVCLPLPIPCPQSLSIIDLFIHFTSYLFQNSMGLELRSTQPFQPGLYDLVACMFSCFGVFQRCGSHSSLAVNYNSLLGWTTHLLGDLLITSKFQHLGIKLLQTSTCRFWWGNKGFKPFVLKTGSLMAGWHWVCLVRNGQIVFPCICRHCILPAWETALHPCTLTCIWCCKFWNWPFI